MPLTPPITDTTCSVENNRVISVQSGTESDGILGQRAGGLGGDRLGGGEGGVL